MRVRRHGCTTAGEPILVHQNQCKILCMPTNTQSKVLHGTCMMHVHRSPVLAYGESETVSRGPGHMHGTTESRRCFATFHSRSSLLCSAAPVVQWPSYSKLEGRSHGCMRWVDTS